VQCFPLVERDRRFTKKADAAYTIWWKRRGWVDNLDERPENRTQPRPAAELFFNREKQKLSATRFAALNSVADQLGLKLELPLTTSITE